MKPAQAPRKTLAAIAAGTVAMAAAMWLAGHECLAFWDSDTYINAFGNILRDGADAIRTPAYPVLVGLCRTVFGEALWVYALVAVQLAAFVATVPSVWCLAVRLVPPRAALVATAVYAWCPTFVSFTMFVMPDIWCVIGVVALLCAAVRMSESPGWSAVARCSAISVALVLLKPSNIYIAIWWGVLALALLCLRDRRWRMCAVPAAAMAVVLGGYGMLVQRQTGYYTVSVVSDINDLGNAAQRRKLVPELAPDSATAALFRQINAADTVTNLRRRQMAFVGTEHLTYAQIHGVMSATKSYDPARWHRGILVRLFESMPSNAFPVHGSDGFEYYAAALHVSFYVVYAVILALMAWLGTCTWRHLRLRRTRPARAGTAAGASAGRRLLWLWALWVLVCGGIATAVIGGFDDYGRLSMGAYPALILLCAAAVAPRRGAAAA